MPKEPPNSLEEVRVHGDIGNNPAELDMLADAVVRRCSICYARIKSLRALIEAVQRHPNAKLAPPREERSEGWKPPDRDSPDAYTELRIFGGAIADTRCEELDIRITLVLSTRFTGEVSFEKAWLAGSVWFDKTYFAGHAGFERTHFAATAWFARVRFAEQAAFEGARFVGYAWFEWAQFAGHARFYNARFDGYATFDKTRFEGHAWFDGARFARHTGFNGAAFAEHAGFEGVRFVGYSWFGGAHFAGTAGFGGAMFARDTWFLDARFQELARFDKARFAAQVVGDMRPCFLRTALFGEKANLKEKVAWYGTWPMRCWHWLMRTFGWKQVRALGQLQILSRVSLAALIGVPGLAALTDVLQAQFLQWPALGTTPALLYFASAFVTLGLLIYQVFAPEEVRKHDEDSFIDLVHQRYPDDAADRDDGLRRAIEHLEEMANRRPDRHRNFVARHGDTIWIPPRDRINWFEDWKREKQTGNDVREGAARASTTDVSSPKRGGGPGNPAPRVGFRTAVVVSRRATAVGGAPLARLGTNAVPGAERRRIVIDEGARAEYWLKSRKHLWAAWVSFVLYGIGIFGLLAILVIQGHRVGHAAGWW